MVDRVGLKGERIKTWILVFPDQTMQVLFLFAKMFVRLNLSGSYIQGMLETSRTLYSLNCACDSLCPCKVTWILSDCSLSFLPLVVPPDAVFLRRHAINVSVCQCIVSLRYYKLIRVLDSL
jgi:hypothetical protein